MKEQEFFRHHPRQKRNSPKELCPSTPSLAGGRAAAQTSSQQVLEHYSEDTISARV